MGPVASGHAPETRSSRSDGLPRARFDVPAATGDFGVTFLGVASLLLDDGDTAVMTDGFFSRPALRKVAFGKLAPNPHRIDCALARLGLGGANGGPPAGRRVPRAHPLRPRDGQRGRRAAHRRGARRRRVGGERRPRCRARCRPHPCRHTRRTRHVRRLHPHLSRITALPTGPLPGQHHRARRAAGQGRRLQVRRGLVDPGRTHQRPYRPAPGQRRLSSTVRWSGRSADVAYLGVGQLGVLDEGYIRTLLGPDRAERSGLVGWC